MLRKILLLFVFSIGLLAQTITFDDKPVAEIMTVANGTPTPLTTTDGLTFAVVENSSSNCFYPRFSW